MRAIRVLPALLLALSAGCYRVTVETGAKPSAQTVEKPFAHGWLFGIVPPPTIETQAKCTNGVAKVDTQMSFANGIVGMLTGYIYTPMAVKVTCADR